MTPRFLARFAQRPHLATEVLDVLEDALSELRTGPGLPWSLVPRRLRTSELSDDVTTRIETHVRAGIANHTSRAEANGHTRDVALNVPRRRGGDVTVAFHALDDGRWMPRAHHALDDAAAVLEIAMEAIRAALAGDELDLMLPAMAMWQLEDLTPGPGPFGDREVLLATPFCPPMAMQDMRRSGETLDPVDVPPCLLVRLQVNEFHRTIVTLDAIPAVVRCTSIEAMRSVSRLRAFTGRSRPTAAPEAEAPSDDAIAIMHAIHRLNAVEATTG